MKIAMFLVLANFSTGVVAGPGPTSLGPVSIGMSKVEYLTAVGVSPIDCSKYRDKDRQPRRSELKHLTPDKKTLCWAWAFEKTATIENIQLGDLSYDVIEANYESSSIIGAVGHSSKAIFMTGRLISVEIYVPKIALGILTEKYGPPTLVDSRRVDICKNRIGNEFKNNVGKYDAVWVNGEVKAILRTINSPPRSTCSDGQSMQYYLLEDFKQIAAIETAIDEYRKSLAKDAAKNTKF